MKLSAEQTRSLLQSVASAKSDDMDCDGCYGHLAEFVELELAGTKIPEALQKVQRHLDQCKCCGEEYDALIEALRELDSA